MLIVFHVNPSQAHQVEHGQWLQSGLRRHGHSLTITPDITAEADIHIVSGPHYAKEYWQGHKTIWLDRAYIPDHQIKSGKWVSEDWVSLGWLNKDGSRTFQKGRGRRPPRPLRDHKGKGSIFLADYNGPIEQADTVRLHPTQQPHAEPLEVALLRHKQAIGYQTTALVAAGLLGLDVVCKDSRNIMADPNWLDLLPYADWHYSEIQSGEAWEHLALSLDQLTNQ